MHARFSKALALYFLVALAFGATPAWAQSAWLGTDRQADVALEVLRPDFGGEGVSFFSSAVFLSGRYPLSEAVDFTIDLPFSHFGVDGGDSETAIGNPYLGIAFGPRERSVYGEFGLRPPLASGDGLATGFISDHDRWEAFFEDVLAINGAVNYVYREPSGFRVRLRGGPSVWVNTGDFGDDVELLADYGAHAWYVAAEQVGVGVGLTGRVIVTEGGLSLSERMLNQVGLTVIGHFGRVQPGLHARLPFDFDEDTEETNYVLSLSLAVPLNP